MKVDINGAGHQVTIECDSQDLSYVIEKTQKLFDETKPTQASPGYAGFQMERGHQFGHGKYGAQFGFAERPEVNRSTDHAD